MFIHDDFLLGNSPARRLYHEHAAKMPVIDYHCHVDVREVADDVRYDNITQAWIAMDHYKWTVMRTNGIPEQYITGKGTDKEKFMAFAASLPRCIGNPVYHRSHMELKNVFGFTKLLSSGTAEEACNEQLRNGLTARRLIKKANVVAMGTTDDILDDMSGHDRVEKSGFDGKVVPTFRTDSVVNIEHLGYREYIGRLSDAAACPIRDFGDLIKAVELRMDFFAKRGCKSIDQALMYVPCYEFAPEDIDLIFRKVMRGEKATEQETAVYVNALLYEIARACRERGWVMQLHVGAKRDINTWLYRRAGVDVGGDCIGCYNNMSRLPHFMDYLNERGWLPKMVIYSINPADNPVLDSMTGCFQQAPDIGKIQHGAAWWFNDTMYGIRNYIDSLANLSVLGTAIGALTDSRAFVTYSRHEYFRRILCDMVGSWMDRGRYPEDYDLVGGMIEDICFHNVNRFFDFGCGLGGGGGA